MNQRHLRAAEWLLWGVAPSPVLREAVLGDLSEVMCAAGRAAFWREAMRSMPALLRARLLAADPLAAMALALVAATPLLLIELLCTYVLSQVPLKASAARPLWYCASAGMIPAALGWYAGAKREHGAPGMWPLAMGLAMLAVSAALPWPWWGRLLAIAPATAMASVRRIAR